MRFWGQHTEWATTGGEVAEVHAEGDADAIAIGDSGDRAFDVATRICGVEESLTGEGSSVDDSRRVVLNDGGVAKDSSDWDVGGLGVKKTKEAGHQDRENGCEMHVGESGALWKGEACCTRVSSRYKGTKIDEGARMCSPAGDRDVYGELENWKIRVSEGSSGLYCQTSVL